jgi:hypothetical protein
MGLPLSLPGFSRPPVLPSKTGVGKEIFPEIPLASEIVTGPNPSGFFLMKVSLMC